MSWPKRIEDNLSFGNFPADDEGILRYQEGLNVGYRYFDRKDSPTPLFSSGFGLSYTTFEVSHAIISPPEMSGVNGTIDVTCKVQNNGKKHGKLVVQLYLESPCISRDQVRRLKELKAFTKIGVAPGQSETASTKLDKYCVSFYDDSEAVWRAEKGTYNVCLGTSATASKLGFHSPLQMGFPGSVCNAYRKMHILYDCGPILH
jgi:beta-glucosidase